MAKQEKPSRGPTPAGFEDEKHLPSDYPVRADLTSIMKIDIAVNKHARVWAVHDRPFPEQLQWVEYDPGAKRLIFVGHSGLTHDFGQEIEPVIGKMLERSDYIETCRVRGNKIEDYGRYRLIKMQTIH